jgi:Flp pilus assembly pilin Flp
MTVTRDEIVTSPLQDAGRRIVAQQKRRNTLVIFAQMLLWQVTNVVTTRFGGAGRARRGQGLIEYALIIALVALFALGALVVFGNKLSGLFVSFSNTPNQPTPTP